MAVWGIPLLIGLTWLGNWWTAGLIAGIMSFGQIEYYSLQKALGRKPAVIPGVLAGIIVIVLWQIGGMEALGWTMASIYLILALTVMLTGRTHTDLLSTFGGVVYTPLLGGSFLMVRSYDVPPSAGLWLALGLFGSIWVCDTAAYAFGRWTGKHRLAPAISPGKTIEGFVWGLVWVAIFSATLWKLDLISWDLAIVLAFAAGLMGQLGDLFESSLKREAGAKDSGTFLPGHGGILDRFDSLLAAAPVLAMYLTIRDYLFSYLSN